jgi:hypothetical protein
MSPGARLVPETVYRLTVLSPPAGSQNGFRAFDGAPLSENTSILFKTASGSVPILYELPSNADLFCSGGCDPHRADCSIDPERNCLALCEGDEVVSDCHCAPSDDDCKAQCVLSCTSLCPVIKTLGGCATANCHKRDAMRTEDLESIAMGLDMSDAAHIRQTAIGVVAHETQEGQSARLADVSPRRFGRAMPRIFPHNAGESYLMYKLLAHHSYAASDAAPPAAEIARLRASVVVGLPMPADPAPPLSVRNLVVLSDWIAAGAPTPGCP